MARVMGPGPSIDAPAWTRADTHALAALEDKARYGAGTHIDADHLVLDRQGQQQQRLELAEAGALVEHGHVVAELFGLFRAKEFQGKEVVARGWYRRMPGPAIELRDVHTLSGRKARSTAP